MAVVRGKKAEEVMTVKQAEAAALKIRATLPKGRLYLENNKRERKATGSYYTPDYIVKYIVKHAVGPVLAEKREALTPRIRAAQKKFAEVVQRKRTVEKVQPDLPGLLNEVAGEALHDLFEVKTLDPAMGSGHFLVEAVDFITDELAQFMSRFPFLNHFFDGTRRTILAEMERQSVTVDPARLTDVNLLKRHVLKRCIYGVDLNPMAVELAKVSLWLDCFTLGAPLSFLDHHLKPGNSLIGARVEEVRAAIEMAGQKDEAEIPLLTGLMGSQFAGVMLATDLMRQVGDLPDTTAEQVKQSRAEYRRASDALAPFKRILDVYTSRWFGNGDTKLSQPAIQFLRDSKHEAWLIGAKHASPLTKADQKIAETALRAAADKRFFHWELEFPEVFFGPSKASAQQIVMKENPGFDAVVGNPPYIRVRTLKDANDPTVAYYEGGNYECAVHVWDIYLLFSEQAQRLARQDGLCAFIMPVQTLHQPNCESLRSLLLSRCAISRIVDLSNLDVFDDAIVKTCILVVGPSRKHATAMVEVYIPLSEEIETSKPLIVEQSKLTQNPGKSFKPDLLSNADVLNKIDTVSETLESLFYVTFGLRSSAPGKGKGGKERLIIDGPNTKHAKPYMEGREIGRFATDWADRFIDYVPEKMYSPREPSLFETPKIVSQSMLSQKRLVATLDLDKKYVEQSLVCIVPYSASAEHRTPKELSLKYVLAIINSELGSFYFAKKIIGDSLGGGLIHATPGSQAMLPIRRIAFTTPEKRRAGLVREGIAEALRWVEEKPQTPNSKIPTEADEAESFGAFAESKMGRWVQERLAAQPEEADVIHDLLAHLAGGMIEMNKEKQGEMKRFLGWLEKAIGSQRSAVSIDDLTGKSKLKNYLGDYQKGQEPLGYDELEDILYKNRGKLGVSVSDARFTAKLRAEYEKSLAALLPLKQRLARTDRLIDLVVYGLYGLTEEEVGVVEGRQTNDNH